MDILQLPDFGAKVLTNVIGVGVGGYAAGFCTGGFISYKVICCESFTCS